MCRRQKNPSIWKKNLLKKYQDFTRLFEFKKTNKLFSFKKSKINHFIELKKINVKISETLWKSLYNMFQNELLILWKILNGYLNKNFIKISNSSEVLFVLFTWKSDEKLRFCVNYRALKRFTRKNHYLLSLIHETLNNISKIKWFMKLDIMAVFEKFHVVEDDEWLKIFRTKYGLFELLIIFFWFNECIQQFSTINQLDSVEIFGRICFNIFEQYIHIYKRFFIWTLKSSTKNFEKITNHWFICCHQQMRIWTSNGQIFKIHCWGRTKYKMNFEKIVVIHELKISMSIKNV